MGFVIESRHHAMMDDYIRRSEIGLPPLMKKGDPFVRGLFDTVWLVRYHVRMRRNPLDDERADQ
ncbi:hypothetical protein BU197_19190 [Streptomyces sp. CBMA291]|nr:hypothetical protein [Streptomyces sp. CBMA291]MBD0712757.1 hypothetical protein [Streptomyces sp. CBMA370]